MIPDKAAEYKIRLDNLARHAWNERLAEALRFYRPKTDLGKLLSSGDPIHLETVRSHLSDADKAHEKEINRLCRPHWEGEGIPSNEIGYRDLLDDALDALSVLELAVEAEYLDVQTLAPRVRPIVLDLCWSHGVRSFIRIYGYETVAHLAARCKVQFPEKFGPMPGINPEAEIAFPGLTTMFTQFRADPAIHSWTRVLDDFIEYKEDRSEFRKYLDMGMSDDLPDWKQRLFRKRLSGGIRFVEQLGDYFRSLERGYMLAYARLFRYFLMRHFGYRQRDRETFEKVGDFSWSDVLLKAVTTPQRLSSALEQDYPDKGFRMKMADSKAKAFFELHDELRKVAEQLIQQSKPDPSYATY